MASCVPRIEANGIHFSDLDMMMAAHAVAVDATLVSRNRAFTQAADRLSLEVWSFGNLLTQALSLSA